MFVRSHVTPLPVARPGTDRPALPVHAGGRSLLLFPVMPILALAPPSRTGVAHRAAPTIPAPHEALQDRAVPLAPTPMADLPRRPATRPDRPTPVRGPVPLPIPLPRDPDPRLDRRASAAGESSIIRSRRYPPLGGE